MFNSTALEVAIGMALVYLLLSLFCTAINEAIAGILGSRAKNLKKGIESLFSQGLFKPQSSLSANGVIQGPADDEPPAAHEDDGKGAPGLISLAQALYDHGLVQSLYKSGSGHNSFALYNKLWTTLPSYIPSRTFSSALIDLIFPDDLQTPPPGADPKDAATTAKTNLDAMLAKIDERLPNGKGKEAIKAMVKQAEGNIATTRLALEKWYDDGMDRAAGWYKRKTQLVLFIIGLLVAGILNVDSINVARTFWGNPTMRSYAVAAADKYAKEHAVTAKDSKPPTSSSGDQSGSGSQTDTDAKKLPDAKQDELATLKSLNLPIGWNDAKLPWMAEETAEKNTIWSRIMWKPFMYVLAGWFLTAIAMTLGAPFWFDTLNQFMVIRSTIKPREKSDVEGSKDPKKKS